MNEKALTTASNQEYIKARDGMVHNYLKTKVFYRLGWLTVLVGAFLKTSNFNSFSLMIVNFRVRN